MVSYSTQTGTAITNLFPNLRGHIDLLLTEQLTVENLANCNIVFFATFNGTAMQSIPNILQL